MPDISITVASGEYDRIRPIREGIVPVEGCAIRYSVVEPNQLFARILKNPEFDVTEMSFSTYVALRDRGQAQYTAIPVFLSRAFRHSAIFVRACGSIASPADLAGKRVGVAEYFTTMLVWMRGLLSDEYGIKPSDLVWRTGPMERAEHHGPGPVGPDGTELGVVAGLDIAHIPAGKTLAGMLGTGEIDAVFSARPPSGFRAVRKDGAEAQQDGAAGDVVRLFPDYRAAEQAYYRKSGLYPLMHAIGIRNSLLEQQPWIAASLYAAFSKAKALAVAEFEKLSAFALTLPWIEAEYRATQAVLGPDIWPYGLNANRKTLDTLCRYLHEQGATQRLHRPEDLFAAGVA